MFNCLWILLNFYVAKEGYVTYVVIFTLVQYVCFTSVQGHVQQLLNLYFSAYFHKYESVFTRNTIEECVEG